MKKDKIIFQFTDKTLTVYLWSKTGLITDSVYALHNPEHQELFASKAANWASLLGCILLNVSSEEFHEEQFPHVQGKNRKLMLERKLGKLFPNSDYTRYKYLKRERSGRKDDIYQLSGVADSLALDPYIDIINRYQIEISGAYSTPLLIKRVIRPVKHDPMVLVIAAGQANENNLPFRQTFLDGGLVHFNRLTSITTSGEPDDIAGKFNREIQRTWQYLNNRRVLKAGGDLEIILVVPDNVETALITAPKVPSCKYSFIRLAELVKQHGAENKLSQPNFSSLTALLLAEGSYKKPHYTSEKLTLVHLHQQAKRYLLAASILLVIATLAIAANNLLKSQEIKQTHKQLTNTLAIKNLEVEKLQNWFENHHTNPEEMRGVVTTARQLTAVNPLPQKVFEIISSGYKNFEDLSLNIVEWKIASPSENDMLINQSSGTSSGKESDRTWKMDSLGDDEPGSEIARTNTPEFSPRHVLVSLEGEVLNFNGNYRQAIERIQNFAKSLENLKGVASVNIEKLPLNIDSSTNISRSLTDRTAPSFILDVQLQQGVW